MSFSKNETQKVKGIAFLFLLFHHMYRTVDDMYAHGADFILSSSFVSCIAHVLRVCVFIFVFVTAYGITLQLIRSQEKHHSNVKFLLCR